MVQIPLCFHSSVFSLQCSEKAASSGARGAAKSLHRGDRSVEILRFRMTPFLQDDSPPKLKMPTVEYVKFD
jgi:hypothetical protein